MKLPVVRAVPRALRVRSHALLPLCLWWCCGAASAATGTIIDLTNVSLSLVSTIDGHALPVTWHNSTWSLADEVRAGDRVDAHSETQPSADYHSGLPVRVTSLLDSGSASVRIAEMFDDVHAAATFGGPDYDVHTAAASMRSAAFVDVPGHARLTLSGHLTVSSSGEAYANYASFTALFALQGLDVDNVTFDHLNTFDQDFSIVADNPYDGAGAYYQIFMLNAYGYTPASPVPEPAPAPMLAAGLLAGAALWRRKNRKGPQPLPV